jgi:hypothetical protein
MSSSFSASFVVLENEIYHSEISSVVKLAMYIQSIQVMFERVWYVQGKEAVSCKKAFSLGLEGLE